MKRLAFLALLAACGAPDDPADHADHAHASERPPAVHLQGTHTLRPAQPFRQVGLILDGPAEGLTYQVRTAAGAPTPPAPVPLTWSEGEAHVGRILLGEAASEIVFSSPYPIEINAEFWQSPQTDPVRPLARDLPLAGQGEAVAGLGTLRQGLAPRELVIPREEWRARNPGLICNNPENVYRISVHHTASPADDGGDPAQRMRQIQAYHIDNNGWCDIGYHFVVSQSGLIFEARRDERAPAAHVGNQNSGNVGICFIGNYEQAQVPDAQFAAGARIMGWVRMTHGVPGRRDVIRGHQEWPGQQTACPGRNLLGRLDELIARSDGGGVEPPPPPPPPAEVAAELRVAWQTPENPHTQGSSAEVPDGFPGQRLEVLLQLHNQSAGPLRGVRLGYAFPPELAPIDYVIETDWPAKDQQTWLTNDADAAPENPPKNQLGPRGELVMYAFGAGETKRVRVTVEVGPYSGRFRPAVQGFVRHIDGAYDQAAFDAEPGTNTVGRRLAEAAELDLISRTEWSFPSPELDDLEGFSTCGGEVEGGGHLTLGADGCAESPPWTAVDADRWDSLVVAVSAREGTRLAVWWPGPAGDEVQVFDVSAPDTWILPMDGHSAWAGVVEQLRLVVDGPATIEHLYPASRIRGEVGSAAVDALEGTVALLVTDEDPPTPGDAGPRPDPAVDGGVEPPQSDAGAPDPGGADGRGDAGCSQARTGSAAWSLAILGLCLLGRRQRRR